MEIQVVPDESIACPECGAYLGNPDPALDFPNRFKVDDFCRCYNPACPIGYYNPYTGEIEYQLPEDERRAMAERVKAQQAEFDKTHEYVRTDDGSVPGYECWEPRLREGLPAE